MTVKKNSDLTYIYPFGSPYRTSQPDDIPHEAYERILYVPECSEHNGVTAARDESIVLSFLDILDYFNQWNQIAERIDLFGHWDETETYRTVYDYLRDTVYQFFHPVEMN